MKIIVDTEKLKELMHQQNYNNYNFAPLVGVDRSYISKIRNGHRQPGRDVAYQIAKVLKVDYLELFTEIEG